MSLPPLRPLLSSYATRGPRSIPRHPPLLLSLPLLSQLHSRGLSSSGPQVQQPPQKGQSSTARQRYPVLRRNARGNHRRKGLWKNVKEIKAAPKLLVLRVEDMDKPMADAASKRWNGRRSLYLGSWKNRRDAAFIKNETRGIPFERTGHPVIDGVLGRETRQVDSYPCIKLEKPPTKGVEKVPGFRIAADSRGINSYLLAAREQLAGMNATRLTEPLPEITLDQPTKRGQLVNWSNKIIFDEIKAVLLNEDVIVIRAIYEFLIRKHLDREYMPGLLRLMIRELAAKGNWPLLAHLCIKAMLRKGPQLKDRYVASLVNHATSLSINSGKGQVEVGQIYRIARRRRGGPEASRLDLREPPSLRYKTTPPVIEFDTDVTGKRIEDVTQKKRLTFKGNVYPFIADATIRFRAVNGRLDEAIQTMRTMTQMFHIVPHYKSINAILRELIRLSNLPIRKPQTQQVSRPSLSHSGGRRSIREFHTSSIVPARSFATSVELASYPHISDRPWSLRTTTWKKSGFYNQVKSGNTELLDTVIEHLNQHNIHFTTIRLLIQLTKEPSQLEIPWTVAQRAKHPKIIIRRVQKDLVEAGYKESTSSPETRHVQLSRGMLLIMRLEGMGIVPSKDSIMIVLRGCIKDGNIPGARALINRLERYEHTLQASEVAEIVKSLPSMGLGTLSTPTGQVPSAMSIRTEQIDFITELRRFIRDPSYLAPYVHALGRCGSASQIWSTWTTIRNRKHKAGVMTAFVEAFSLAKDPDSALQFVREAYREGYTMNFYQARAIAGCVEAGRRRVGIELLREMIIQTPDVHHSLMEGIIRIILKTQGVLLRGLNEERKKFISDVSVELIEIIEANRTGRDIGRAVTDIERILSAESE